jgi:hypothetical protein
MIHKFYTITSNTSNQVTLTKIKYLKNSTSASKDMGDYNYNVMSRKYC